MTTSPARRRRSTWIAFASAAVALVVAIGLTVLGAATLANSQAGRDATDDSVPLLSLPYTPTALVGVVDGDGALTSVAVLVLDPSGIGGSVVSVAANADSTLDLGDDRLPLDETLATEGPDAFRLQAEALMSVSFDVAELADEARLTELLSSAGTIPVELPRDVEIRAGTDVTVVPAGVADLDPAMAAAVLTATVEGEPDHEMDPVRDAVWAGFVAAAGGRAGTADAVEPADEQAATARPADLAEVVERLLAGPVAWRNLRYEVPAPERNPRGVDVVVPDRAEVLLVVGQIAPARVAAPNPSLTFRVEAGFPDDALDALDLNDADVAALAIDRLLFVQANVISVDTSGDDPPAVTRAYVADASVMDVVGDSYPLVFGELEVLPAEYRIAGVDVIVVLGETFLDKVRDTPLTDADLDGTVFSPDTAAPPATDDDETEDDQTDGGDSTG